MKKLFVALLLPLALASCSKSAESPTIELVNLYVNGDPQDYSQEMSSIPPLKVNDKVEIRLILNGNGEELNTFLVQEGTHYGGAPLVSIDFEELQEEALSEDKEFTDKKSGKLGFKDGYSQLSVTLKAKVQQVTLDGVVLYFYLFSKPMYCEGAKYELKLKLAY